MASQSDMHAEQEQRAGHGALGGTPSPTLPPRRGATVCGTLRSVTLRPRAGVPALVAELYDGSGSLYVVWLGRRQIAGIEPGRRLRIAGHGRPQADGQRALFNPRYELVPGRCPSDVTRRTATAGARRVGPGTPRRACRQVIAEQFSLQAAIGGPRGLVESVLPMTVFSVVWAFTHDLPRSRPGRARALRVLAAWRLVAAQSR